MKFEDIEVGKVYNIQYIDPHYPCRCQCHTTPNMLHCVPCCYDMSYTGPALCCSKLESLYKGEVRLFIDFYAGPKESLRHMVLFPENVLDKVEE